MKNLSLTPPIVLLCLVAASCSNNENKNQASQTSSSNPLMVASTLPFQTIPFDKIKDADFQPAIEEGMKQKLEEIQKIANNPEPPTFDNTFVSLEKSGQLLRRATYAFNVLTGANTNPELQKVKQEEAPKLSANEDAMYLNSKLFKRVEAIYNQREQLKLDSESERLVEYYYQKFILQGARLSDADKDKLKKLNEERATLSAQFTNRLLAATKAGALVVNDSVALAGLSSGKKDAAAVAAKNNNMDGKWLIALQNTTQQPDLASLSDRGTREKLFDASWNRAEKNDSNDTRKIIARIAEIRAEQAKLLGFKNYVEWKLQDQMAKTPEAVDVFLAKLIPRSYC